MANELIVSEENEFLQARKRLVCKRVDAIQFGRMSFSPVETKAIDYMISKIKPGDGERTLYYFNVKEFCRMIQWNRFPTQELLGMLQQLADKSWWKLEGEEYDLKRWFNIVRLNEKKGIITITFSESVWPYIFRLQDQQKEGKIYYGSWSIDSVSLMKNPYSIRIFELLKTYQVNNERWLFENGTGSIYDIQTIICNRDDHGNPLVPVGWSNFSNFTKRVLKPSTEEINKYTDIQIAYTPHKRTLSGERTKGVSSIEFLLSEKTALEKERRDRELDEIYNNSIGQQDTGAYFFEEREWEQKRSDAEMKSRETEKSSDPLLKDSFPEFTDRQLLMLRRKAMEKIVPGVVAEYNYDLFVCDYINEYYQMVLATPEQTKSSMFARLYDMVDKDYNSKGYHINQKYDRSMERPMAKEPIDVDMKITDATENELLELVKGIA